MLPITIPYLGEEEATAAQEVIRSGWVSQGPKVAEFERVVAEYCQTEYRMTDIQAAVGIERMKRLDWIVQRRRELASRYTVSLANHPWLRSPYVHGYADFNFQSYAVQLTEDAPISRDELMQRLLDVGISTRRGIMLAHIEPAYAGHHQAQRLQTSERASARSVLLPLYPQMTSDEQDRVLAALFGECSHSRSAPPEASWR